MFLANLAHESAEFRYMQELSTGDAYENNIDLQNNLPEAKAWAAGGRAGPWFKGHGPIQITGYKNHKKYSLILFGDETTLLKYPLLLCEPRHGCRAAAAFVREEGCLAAADADDFLLYCQIINAPPSWRGTKRLPNGWADRFMYYERAKNVISGEQS
jgi:putative chitinase